MIVRKGMWVVTKKGVVGIVNAITTKNIAPEDAEPMVVPAVEFHPVLPDGTTALIPEGPFRGKTMAGLIPVADLRQATLDEIPAPRRPSDETAKHFGYA